MTREQRTFLISQLRRISFKWPAYTEAWRRARVGWGLYYCAACVPRMFYFKKNCQLDHIDPVVPVTGWQSLESFCVRLLCPVDRLQVMCAQCHQAKSNAENVIRRAK